jgi:hypothetical protein
MIARMPVTIIAGIAKVDRNKLEPVSGFRWRGEIGLADVGAE